MEKSKKPRREFLLYKYQLGNNAVVGGGQSQKNRGGKTFKMRFLPHFWTKNYEKA